MIARFRIMVGISAQKKS